VQAWCSSSWHDLAAPVARLQVYEERRRESLRIMQETEARRTQVRSGVLARS
jgi:hypothetical protein